MEPYGWRGPQKLWTRHQPPSCRRPLVNGGRAHQARGAWVTGVMNSSCLVNVMNACLAGVVCVGGALEGESRYDIGLIFALKAQSSRRN